MRGGGGRGKPCTVGKQRANETEKIAERWERERFKGGVDRGDAFWRERKQGRKFSD